VTGLKKKSATGLIWAQ